MGSSLHNHVGPGARVEVQWVDALTCRHMEIQGAAWVHVAEDEAWELPHMTTVGYVLHVDEEKIVLTSTSSLACAGCVDVPLILPIGCVVSLVILNDAEVYYG